MKITIIAGARPNFMKIAPLMRAIRHSKNTGKRISARLVYTGSADDPSIEPSLFDDLDMPQPDAYLRVDETDFFKRTAGILTAFAIELKRHPAHAVIVVDDFTPTMACSIVAKKMGVKVVHLVAGTRSFDTDAKEINRIVTDSLSDILFTAGMAANRNLSNTGTEQRRVYLVGNILIDTLRYNLPRMQRPVSFSILHVKDGEYVLLTLNRRDLVHDERKLRSLMESMLANTSLPIVAPLHTYVRDRLEALLIRSDRLHLLPPQPCLSFGYMVRHAKAILTDSGNIAEEATFLHIPCITLNTYTEHPETISKGTNCLVGEDPEQLKEALDKLHRGAWPEGQLPERWDGHTAERIVTTLLHECEE